MAKKRLLCIYHNSPILEGVPLLPEFDVYKLAEEILKSHSDYNTEGFSDYQNGRLNGIIEGLEYTQSLYPKFFIPKLKLCRCRYGSFMTSSHPCKNGCKHIESLDYETTNESGNISIKGEYEEWK